MKRSGLVRESASRAVGEQSAPRGNEVGSLATNVILNVNLFQQGNFLIK